MQVSLIPVQELRCAYRKQESRSSAEVEQWVNGGSGSCWLQEVDIKKIY
jgi:hypothetical protein